MAIMFGNGEVAANAKDKVVRTTMVRLDKSGKLPNTFVADVYDSETKSSVRKEIYMKSDEKPEGTIKFTDSKLKLVSLTREDGTVIQPDGTENDAFTASEWTNIEIKNGEGSDAKAAAYEKVFVTYEAAALTRTITISGDSFPGTYYITGDTYARSDVTGADQFFQFVIPKAKVTSENTITLEAEGDPSVFSMNLTVLRPESGDMMKLVQYDLTGETIAAG
jgi:hypothetical protein